MSLYEYLPSKTQVTPSTMLFQASKDGYYLKSLYKYIYCRIFNFSKCKYTSTPTLLLIMTDSNVIIGSYLSHPPSYEKRDRDDGETFIFKFNPNDEIKCYYWTHCNRLFTYYSEKELCIGCEGGYAIYIDEHLHHGSTHSTSTFGNPALQEEERFICRDIEIWSFEW